MRADTGLASRRFTLTIFFSPSSPPLLEGEQTGAIAHLLGCASCRERACDFCVRNAGTFRAGGQDPGVDRRARQLTPHGSEATSTGCYPFSSAPRPRLFSVSSSPIPPSIGAPDRRERSPVPHLEQSASCSSTGALPRDREEPNPARSSGVSRCASRNDWISRPDGAERIADLRARAWASIANDRRMRSDLRGAREAMAKAFAHLRQGTGDPVERAICWSSRRRSCAPCAVGSGHEAIERAFSIFREHGDTHRAGRVLLNTGTVHLAAGQAGKGHSPSLSSERDDRRGAGAGSRSMCSGTT